MAKHEFGIMKKTPTHGKRYDEYEPEKYCCISVDDEYIENITCDLDNIDFYWHTIDKAGKGLAYFGITLIPPKSINSIIKVIDNKKEFNELKILLLKAKTENKFVIHYGI